MLGATNKKVKLWNDYIGISYIEDKLIENRLKWFENIQLRVESLPSCKMCRIKVT